LKILITGIKGFIGSQIEQTLKKRSKIFGISSDTEKNDYKKLIKKRIRPNIIFHCAGSGLVGINKITHSIHRKKNLDSTKNLIKFINKIKLKNSKIIFLSSQSVYGKVSGKKISESHPTIPISSYGKTKLLAEKKIMKITNNSVIVLRLFSIYGIGLKKQILWDACCKFKKKDTKFKGNGQEKRDFLNINDLIKLIKKIIVSNGNNKNELYNVGSGAGIKIRNLLLKLKSIYKLDKKLFFLENQKKSEHQDYISSNKKIIQNFKWKISKNLYQELKQYVRWFKKNYE